MNEDMIQAKAEGRFRAVAVSTNLLKEIFQGKVYLKSDLPENVEVEGVHYDHMRSHGLIVRLVSPRFEPIPEHTEIPVEAGQEVFYVEHVDEED